MTNPTGESPASHEGELMKELIKDHWAIDGDTDVIRDGETGRYYLREYKHRPTYDIRDSVDQWDTRREAAEAHEAGCIVWEGWG